MSWAVWITGPPGTGRSDVAHAAVDALTAAGNPVELLALCEMRRMLTPRPTRSDAERDIVYRALVYVASTLVDSGIPVVIDAMAHRRAWRDLARAAIAAFTEVELTLDGTTPDVGVSYEPAQSPELIVDTTQEPPCGAGAQVARLVIASPRGASLSAATGCAVWLTGLPGSGKTTIASLLAQALTERGVAVRILDLADVLTFVANLGWSPLAEDIAHRALVYAAKRLSAAGFAVIVDATAPSRAWRDLARDTIERFAEVQLECPAGVCASRERAVRWRLMGCPHRSTVPVSAAGPDIAFAYEYALCPEVTIHTDVEDAWSAAETVLRLVLRMRSSDRARVA